MELMAMEALKGGDYSEKIRFSLMSDSEKLAAAKKAFEGF